MNKVTRTLALAAAATLGFVAARSTAPVALEVGESQSAGVSSLAAVDPAPEGVAALPAASDYGPLSLYLEIQSGSPDRRRALAARILALPERSPHRLAALDMLMQLWAAEDPRGALSFAATLHGADFESAMGSALDYLGVHGYASSSEWLVANLKGARLSDARIWLLRGMAETSPQLAMEAVAALPEGRLKGDALSTIVVDWAQRDAAAAFDWFETASWSANMDSLYQSIMGFYMEQNPAGARAMIERVDPASYWRDRWLEDLTRTIAARDPASALETAQSIRSEANRADALSVVFEEWGAIDPEASFEVALSLQSEASISVSTRLDVARQAAFNLLWSDMDEARRRFFEMPEGIRQEIAGPLANQLMETNPTAAEGWARGFDKESIEYNVALGAVAAHYADWDPEQAIRSARDITYSDIRNGATFAALRNLHYLDEERARQVAGDSSSVPAEVAAAFENWLVAADDGEARYLLPTD